MSYQMPLPNTSINQPPPAPTILLQRLACPYLPLNNTVGNAQYNPYVTVDYMQNVDADSSGSIVGPASPAGYPNNEITSTTGKEQLRQSEGRYQPYYGYSADQTAGRKTFQVVPTASKTPQHSFYSVNTQVGNGPFDWLVHLDRKLTSPMELLHVSAFKPHELTQEFKNPLSKSNLTPYNHRAPWFDEDITTAGTSHLLYRLFEFVETRNLMAGMSAPATTSSTAIALTNPGTPQPFTVTPQTMTGITLGGMPVNIQAGMILLIDAAGNPETVRVVSATATTFTANFVRNHNNGQYTIQLLSNSGSYPAQQLSAGERIPGKININTIWDQETLNALCDALNAGPAPNNFTQADVNSLWTNLMMLRSSNLTLSSTDSPFWSLATGLYPAADTQYANFGINNTLLRSATAGGAGNTQRLFETLSGGFNTAGSTTPYSRYQLLSKIFNNVTTRSNVFGVWLTVGFFEVTDDTQVPVQLGAEIGRSENRNIRHRMFAIVDRSNLVVQINNPALLNNANGPVGVMQQQVTTTAAAIPGPGSQSVNVGQIYGTVSLTQAQPIGSWAWSITTGAAVTIDTGANQETVSVTAVTGGASPSITANFTRNHAANVPIALNFLPGNPGPQTHFNPRDNTAVVPYMSIIQ
jgi:hypothetical protein